MIICKVPIHSRHVAAWTREHAKHVGMWARKSTQDTLGHVYVSTHGTLAREHVSIKATLAREYVFRFLARTASNLADSILKNLFGQVCSYGNSSCQQFWCILGPRECLIHKASVISMLDDNFWPKKRLILWFS